MSCCSITLGDIEIQLLQTSKYKYRLDFYFCRLLFLLSSHFVTIILSSSPINRYITYLHPPSSVPFSDIPFSHPKLLPIIALTLFSVIQYYLLIYLLPLIHTTSPTIVSLFIMSTLIILHRRNKVLIHFEVILIFSCIPTAFLTYETTAHQPHIIYHLCHWESIVSTSILNVTFHTASTKPEIYHHHKQITTHKLQQNFHQFKFF